MSMLENLKKLESEGKVGGSDYFKVQNGNKGAVKCSRISS
jgi:hypothetical protein